jgi:DNA-binding SARP family transcriptional activator
MSEPRTPAEVAIELFELGEYDRLEELLEARARADDRRREQTARDELLDVIHLICRSRSDDEAEATFHRAALARIRERQLEQERSLEAIVDRIDGSSRERDTDADAPAASIPPTPTALAVHCLGSFRVYVAGRAVEHWSSSKGKAILKFLVSCPEHRAPKERLMELLWPDGEPRAARNRLNVAVYGLRQALSTVGAGSIVVFRNDAYLLDPDLDAWIDHEAFREHLAAGRNLERQGRAEPAMSEYRLAESLYQGEFLEEDPYEEWPEPLRRSLKDQYVVLLDRLARSALDRRDHAACVELSRKMTAVDPCDEEPHRRLMLCWSRLGLVHLAVRQFLECRDTLARELGVGPSRETAELFRRIQHRETV